MALAKDDIDDEQVQRRLSMSTLQEAAPDAETVPGSPQFSPSTRPIETPSDGPTPKHGDSEVVQEPLPNVDRPVTSNPPKDTAMPSSAAVQPKASEIPVAPYLNQLLKILLLLLNTLYFLIMAHPFHPSLLHA